MNFYKLKIKYKGTRYQGWQKQTHTEMTIQGQLEKALSKISKSNEIHSIGSGRTDSGVHALSQYVRVRMPLKIEAQSLRKAINSILPRDIECLTCEDSTEDFHPTFGAKDKTYRYVFSLGKRSDALAADMMTFMSRDLDIEKMKSACGEFIGEHDFADFFTTGTKVSSTVRTIFECSLYEESPAGFMGSVYPKYFVFEVKGSGFLKQMVRLMVSTIWNIGEGKVSVEDLRGALSKPTGRKLAAVAPPQGLFLSEVNY